MENQSTPLIATFEGHISNTLDALVAFEACLNGTLNHVGRRPHDRERQELIKSGHVFIYEEHASGIKRWTDGVSWSPSRILGNFLIYRELEKPFPAGEKKRALKRPKKAPGISKPEHSSPANLGYVAGLDPSGANKDQERSLIGSLVDSYPFKPDGLVKKTISITYQGVPHHLVSYYSVDDVTSGRLQTPSKSPGLSHIVPRSELFLSQNFRTPVDEINEAGQDHHGILAATYGGAGSFGNGSAGLLHHAVVHGSLRNAMHASHQNGSSSAYLFPHGGATQNGYSNTMSNPNFQAAMQQQMPYPHTTDGHYSLDPSKAERFASAGAIGHEFPRNMPSSATSSRRPSMYDVSGHQTDMGNMPFASHGTETRPVASNGYMTQQNYYMQSQRSVAANPQTSTFPVARGLKADTGSLSGDDGVNQPYNLEDTSGVWNFDTLGGNTEPQYFSGHSQGHVQWPNSHDALHRT